MRIKILGSGCANCQKLEKNTQQAVASLGAQADIEKVTEIADILGYGVVRTPALVVDDEVLVSGRVPRPGEIVDLLSSRS